MFALPSIWTPPKKKVSIRPWAAQSKSSLAPSVKLLYLFEWRIVTLNLLFKNFASSLASKAAAPGIGEAAPTATCLSFFNKSVVKLFYSDKNRVLKAFEYIPTFDADSKASVATTVLSFARRNAQNSTSFTLLYASARQAPEVFQHPPDHAHQVKTALAEAKNS